MTIVGIPEKEEGMDPCALMEKWLTETLNMHHQVVLEYAHRIMGFLIETRNHLEIIKSERPSDLQKQQH